MLLVLLSKVFVSRPSLAAQAWRFANPFKRPQDCSCLGLITDQRDGNHIVTNVTDKQSTELLKRYLDVEINNALDDLRIRIASASSPGSAAKQPCRARTRPGARRRDTRQLPVKGFVDIAQGWTGGYKPRVWWRISPSKSSQRNIPDRRG